MILFHATFLGACRRQQPYQFETDGGVSENLKQGGVRGLGSEGCPRAWIEEVSEGLDRRGVRGLGCVRGLEKGGVRGLEIDIFTKK